MLTRTVATAVLLLAGLAISIPSPVHSQKPDSKGTLPADARDKPYLGMSLTPVPPILSMHLPDVLEANSGALVNAVDPDSPADDAGIELGDILVEFGNDKVADDRDVERKLKALQPDTEIEMVLIRRGRPVNVSVTVGTRPAGLANESIVTPWGDLSELGAALGPELGSMVPAEGFEGMKESMEKMQEMMDKMNQQFGQVPEIPAFSDFFTINVNKVAGDRYRVKMKYKADDGESRDFNMEGTTEEIREAAEAEEAMPSKVRERLMRSLNTGGNMPGFDELLKQFKSQNLPMDKLKLPNLPKQKVLQL
jgi:membrane-associated protease RseP (regulator of RpoE activity)